MKIKDGITLISLVITIIVLLILATVAISLAVDSNGLFSKSGDASNKWNTSVAEEQTTIGSLLDTLENVSPTPDASGANAPKVPTGANVKYVTWVKDETIEGQYNEVLSDTRPTNWHNYNEKQWANIKTISKTANEDGTYNEAYWVWIPRYAYQVPERPTAESDLYADVPTFKIAFLQGTTDIPVDSTILNGAEILPNTTESVQTGDWVVHPAFNFGGTQIEGIWVAKYEASSNAPDSILSGGGDTTEYQVQVKPNALSWSDITPSNMFVVCRNMADTTGVLEGTTTADPHMMKNVEWGAVVYLAQSIYGKNGVVWYNPYYDGGIVFTGKASKETEGARGGQTTDCYSYNEGNGPEASTTGNVYGIYDMAGGSQEYVAAHLNESSMSSDTDIASIVNANIKYKDVYELGVNDRGSSNYEAILDENGKMKKYGDAVYETSYGSVASWQNGGAALMGTDKYGDMYPALTRGGAGYDGNYLGLFSFDGWKNGASWDCSFRPVCIN